MKTTTNKKLFKERRIRLWLLSGKTLTQEQAKERFGCWRLASVVHKMRLDGIKIDTKIIYENGDNYARYSVIKSEKVSRVKSVLKDN